MRSQSVAELAERLAVLDLADRHPLTDRHRTVRATLDWSHDLLTSPARVLLRRLAVFAGFTLPDAEAVVPGSFGDHLDNPNDIATLLDELVVSSLVVFDPANSRYRLLEPVRQYAAQRLDRAAEGDQLRERHARHTLAATLERTQRWVAGPDPSPGFDRDNLELALAWCQDVGDDELLFRSIAGLRMIWMAENADQGMRWTLHAVEHLSGMTPRRHASILLSAGFVHQTALLPDPRCVEWLEEACTLYDQLGNDHNRAWATWALARHLYGPDRDKGDRGCCSRTPSSGSYACRITWDRPGASSPCRCTPGNGANEPHPRSCSPEP